MKTLHSVVPTTMAVGTAACVPTIAGPYYTMDIRLTDGKPVRCVVNQPVHLSGPPPEPLTMRERNEAEVLMTQPLRIQTGPRSPYPVIHTAPDMQCPALPQSGD